MFKIGTRSGLDNLENRPLICAAGTILATAYLRLLSRQATKPQTTRELARSEESSKTASEVAIAVRKTSVMSPEARQDGGRNANPSKELR